MAVKLEQKTALMYLLIIFIMVLFVLAYTSTKTTSAKSIKGTKVPIIMYHSILSDEKKTGEYVTTVKQLENDLLYLKEKGYTTITVSDLIKYKEDETQTLPEKPIIITFDDGSYNNYVYAFEMLKRLEMKAVISVVGKYTFDLSKDKKQNADYSYLSFSQIKEMSDTGIVEIANHSFDMHNSYPRLGAGIKKGETKEDWAIAFKEDTLQLNSMLEEKVGITTTCYAYPFGKIINDADGILEQLGFKATLSCREKVNYINKQSSLFSLGRFNRPHGKTSQQFFSKILD